MKIHHIQWTGQFHVASLLSHRGYYIAFTLGNAKETDIIVSTSDGQAFPIEVKTTRKKSPWWHIKYEPPNDTNRFWAFVSLGPLGTMPRTFLARSDEVRERWLLPRPKGNFPGLKERQIEDWENRWEILP